MASTRLLQVSHWERNTDTGNQRVKFPEHTNILNLWGGGGGGCGLPRALMELDGDVTMMYEDLFFYNPVRKICRSIVSIISLFALTK